MFTDRDLTGHFHLELNEMIRDRGTPDLNPTWLPVFRGIGINIVYFGDFHDDSDIHDPGPSSEPTARFSFTTGESKAPARRGSASQYGTPQEMAHGSNPNRKNGVPIPRSRPRQRRGDSRAGHPLYPSYLAGTAFSLGFFAGINETEFSGTRLIAKLC